MGVEDLIDDIFSGSTASELADILAIKIGPGSIYNRIHDMYDSVAVIGSLILIIFFLIDLIKKMSNENFTLENLFKSFIGLVFGVLLINNAFDFLINIVQAGIYLMNYIADFSLDGASLAGMGAVEQGLRDKNSSLGALDIIPKIQLWVSLFIVWIIIKATELITWCICFQRLLSMYTLVVMAGIGLADCAVSGLSGTGMKYLKQIMAVAFQGAIILMFVFISNQLISPVFCAILGVAADEIEAAVTGASMGELWKFMFAYAAVLISRTMAIVKSESMAKSVMGV